MADGKQPGSARQRGTEATVPVRGNVTGANTNTNTKRERVLVVDDVEDNRDLYATYFEHWGFDTDQACDGEEALAKVTKEPPDVVIMDLSMPNLDGWEATRLIKSNPRTTHVIVIVVTGNSTERNMASARAAGANEVCSKPCLPKDLLARVEQHLAVRARKNSERCRV